MLLMRQHVLIVVLAQAFALQSASKQSKEGNSY